MSYNNSYPRIHEAQELIDLQVTALQRSIPEHFIRPSRKSSYVLSEKERQAVKKSVWYILQRGYARSSASAFASEEFKCSKELVVDCLNHLFPNGYFQNLDAAKLALHVRRGRNATEQEAEEAT